ncbi:MULTISPECIES: hypothetical protein [Acetobacter]|uniref:DUF4169 domain-containing protein n=1 Tax=Acetobacter thailandicus TaxID=1502842 RepID=A0ABT3QGZ2_9PROT|nr:MULTISPECIES: hypothetical protein [Acetobacter]MBS0961323.1 hypothetical protein [Acetobacter thailandicus]MBS0980074.1 hypothetical protein [Acetobacter thailandicus]MBS0986264.1 hypothetical protein [Acetobacter thailandicus]MBS1003038.1 hypothetical protein [Acetobacter thailandicus]MCX2564557.1 hypothetical protein [Acetobacter thailandicus]
MTDSSLPPSAGTNVSAKTLAAKAARAEKEAAALRANLRRRKQQARTRQEEQNNQIQSALPEKN